MLVGNGAELRELSAFYYKSERFALIRLTSDLSKNCLF